MKTFVLACVLSWLGIPGVRADLTVVQKIQDHGQDTENTSRFKDGKTRVDTSPGTSLIMDQRSDEIINLVHGSKTYFRVPSKVASAAVESLTQARDSSVDAKPTFSATGKVDTISGFATEEYVSTSSGVKMTLWLTKALPDYQIALKSMGGALSQGLLGLLMQSFGVDLAGLPGFPIRTVLELQPGKVTTRTVVSVSTQPVPDSEFEIPAGYREIAVPVLTPPAVTKSSPTPP